MPSLSNRREHSEQSISLPLSRETSSIPRGDTDTNWEYPSPQQMYNAMLRKGYTDTPADAVESMVAVHNFLNEGAWNEIVEWEEIFRKGLRHGWEQCIKGDEGRAAERAKMEIIKQRRRDLGLSSREAVEESPRLIRFMGRPGDRTPKASIMQAIGWAFPEKYGYGTPISQLESDADKGPGLSRPSTGTTGTCLGGHLQVRKKYGMLSTIMRAGLNQLASLYSFSIFGRRLIHLRRQWSVP